MLRNPLKEPQGRAYLIGLWQLLGSSRPALDPLEGDQAGLIG